MAVMACLTGDKPQVKKGLRSSAASGTVKV
jgi:hypothetical protein